MSRNAPDARTDAPLQPKSQLPTIIGSFVTGVAAITLVGVLAPTIAAAGATDQIVLEEPADAGFDSAPTALSEITEAQRAEIDARLAEAEAILAAARDRTDAALARLDRLTPR